jgi:hypothetical protein
MSSTEIDNVYSDVNLDDEEALDESTDSDTDSESDVVEAEGATSLGDCQEEGQLTEFEKALREANPDEDDIFWARLRLIAEIKEAREDVKHSEDEIESYRTALKEQKEDLEASKNRVNRLLDELFSLESPKVPKIADKSVEPTATPVDENGWRSIPSLEVLSGIKGLGAKKLDALVELCPTLGALEYLRGEASKNGYGSFHDALPKGFGQATSDAIEDKMLEVIRKWTADQDAMTSAPTHVCEETPLQEIVDDMEANEDEEI